MRILAIDPGSEQSAYVLYEGGVIIEHDILKNDSLICKLVTCRVDTELVFGKMAIEMVASYGMPVGKSVFETCVWIGRFIQAAMESRSYKVYRSDVKMHLCNSMRAKDGNIRQALIDRYEPTGGGKCPQIGTKSKPGPLYGVSTHLWAALAVAVTFDELYEKLIERI